MKKLSAQRGSVLAGAMNVNAESWLITAYGNTYYNPAPDVPLATFQVIRTPNAYDTWDSYEIHLNQWLIPALQTGGPHGVGAEINVICGTFTAIGGWDIGGGYIPGGGISLPGSNTMWKYGTTWDYADGTPTHPAPASFVNFENTAGTFVRTGDAPNYASLWGAWYGNTDGSSNLAVVDYTPPGSGNDDLKDQTLFAKFYVTHDTYGGVNFVAKDDGVDAIVLADGNSYRMSFDMIIPEPGTFVLLGSGLMGLLGYAWRKRKS